MPRLHRSRIDDPGIGRDRAGNWVSGGRRVSDADELERIRALAIPPAWEDVWVCPDPLGHIQAVGRDAAGRRQYLYHAQWSRRQAAVKFDRALALAESLPQLRRSVGRDLAAPGFPRRRALAAALRLIDTSAVRIGSQAYLDRHGSRGVTTLLCRHVAFDGEVARFEFPAKSGQLWRSETDDAALVRYLREVVAARRPGQRLLAWRDDGWHSLSPAEINADLRARSGGDFTAKDFRTLAGTSVAAAALARAGPRRGREARTAIVEAVRATADALGNTPPPPAAATSIRASSSATSRAAPSTRAAPCPPSSRS